MIYGFIKEDWWTCRSCALVGRENIEKLYRFLPFRRDGISSKSLALGASSLLRLLCAETLITKGCFGSCCWRGPLNASSSFISHCHSSPHVPWGSESSHHTVIHQHQRSSRSGFSSPHQVSWTFLPCQPSHSIRSTSTCGQISTRLLERFCCNSPDSEAYLQVCCYSLLW